MPKLLSLAELQKLIDDRHTEIEALLRKREQLEKNVQSIDDEIHEFLNPGSIRRLKRPRHRNESSLRVVIHGILSKNKKGLRLAEITAKVEETGYKSFSANLKNIVYQCLYKSSDISLDKPSGRYSLSK